MEAERQGCIRVYTPEKMRERLQGRPGEKEMEGLLGAKRGQLSKLYILPDKIIGVIMAATGVAGNQHPLFVPYELEKNGLVLVAEKEEGKVLGALVERVEYEPEDTSGMVFGRFLELVMQCDLECLQEIEVTCCAMEEWLVSEGKKDGKTERLEPTKDILYYRKLLLMRNFNYQQLADTCDMLAVNEKGFFEAQEITLIEDIGRRAQRLYDYSQMLREYLVQIRELYQQQLDLKQNKTMQALTVVTTIFLPLTLIAGWYGMNFAYMPELKSPYGYWVIVGIALFIVAGEIVYFRKKKYI